MSKHLSDSRLRPKTFIHKWLQKHPNPHVTLLETDLTEEEAFFYEKFYWELNV